MVDIDDNPKSPTVGSPFNFLVSELEGLRWEEAKGEMGTDQKSIWGKQPNHAIDPLTYILVSIATPQDRDTGMPPAVIGGIQSLDPSLGMF